MPQQPLQRSTLLSFVLLLLLLLIIMNKSDGISLNSSSSLCNSSFDCGNNVILRYPFWRVDVTSPSVYCGYPNFGVSCFDDARLPILRLPSDAYYVKSINYSSETFTLIDIDLYQRTCPRPNHNVTLSYLPNVNYTPSDLNLTFFFNSTSDLLHSPLSSISCFSNGLNLSYVFTEGDQFLQLQGFHWNLHCQDKVVVPVTWSSDLTNLSTDYGGALQTGFDLNWGTLRNCVECEDSGGRCGYNLTAMEFLCFCSDEVLVGSTYNSTCHLLHVHHGKKRNLVLTLTIAFGSLGVGMILACVMFFICYRRRHHKGSLFNPVKGNNLSPSSTPLSRNIASNSSCKDPEKCSTYFGVHVFTYDELEEATNNFNSERELGDGGFGTVYHGKLRDGREVAVKRLYENNFKRVEQFMNEVDILTRIRHQSLVTLYGCTSRHSRELLLVYEFIPNGTVADHLHGDRKTETGKLSWPIRMSIAIETATALSYLHASDIIHRDVKTNNILLDNNFRVKVADFGLSRLFPTDVTHVSTAPQGTPGYVDPEYHQCYQLTDKSDVYSFGVVLIELISSMPAVDINRHRHEINLSNLAINKIKNQALHELVDPCLGYETECVVKRMITSVAELAFCCLQLEKEMRPSMDEVLKSLKQIEREDYTMEKAEGVVIQTDTIGLLKNTDPPFSPDSVTNKWVSRSTTPNASA
ncbi:LEAF RUST 10 DISEASE-RESISTANCE LOCUS RECEPTOR-LIKE PROTEIN KINASE-like 1.2 isoform X5 [Macadamia integrifolia]|uniref:LEAF RUST 10 DISEASE-RESISTANCE LOCUS RECEPTOR-LIKE PROTEIN KINASE-like 1.2 isoform X5 n=1 Tax=Macadamia integrifolia TaxID=60698 RepID=UPI001C4E5A82|nr:LEAF RUST 10 DISEASE-RESISTANCE LOCUS RECEPTOR-LIKE PROTEIN KINASE-like 1.2 isoform X5 [Macadamia integrifolia]